MVTMALLASVLVAAVGVGYTASRPLLDDGSAFLAKGHTVVHVNGETSKSDAQVALQLATGQEELQLVRLPDGRLVVVNKTTGALSYVDSATMSPVATTAGRATSAGTIEPVATASGGYLVDSERDTVEPITVPGQPAAPPVRIAEGIAAVVPAEDSLWVLTSRLEVVEVRRGHAVRTIRLGAPPVGITVADSHPVVVDRAGAAYAVDADQPLKVGDVGVSGDDLVLGSWRGAGRYVVAVSRGTGRVGVLDPRTGHRLVVTLAIKRAELGAPVVLGNWIYVPDYAGPSLWRINVSSGAADGRPLDVPGQPGHFDLVVSGHRVWANSQYDRRVLVMDADGHDHLADTGPRAEVGDSEGRTGPPGGDAPPQDDEARPTESTPEGPPGEATGPLVTVPALRGRPYQQACAEIQRLRLRCRPVAAGDQAGLGAGDVIGTDPRAGARVPTGSRVIVRYVGPVRTPSVIGVPYQEACRRIRAAGLRCVTRAEPDPVLAPEQLGLVSTQDPAPSSSIDKGATVSLTYRNSIALPNLVDQTRGAACDAIENDYRMRCRAVAGSPPPAGKQVGQVYGQDPPAQRITQMGTTVTVTFYRGDSAVGSYAGTDVDSACAAVQAEGFACDPREGTTAWGTGQACRTVYEQTPAAGTRNSVGSAVTLTFRSCAQDLPAYVGAEINAACVDINARGFRCNPVANPYPSTNVVVAQDQPAGRYPLGSAITVHYSPWPVVEYWSQVWGNSWQANEIVVGNPGHAAAIRLGLGYRAGEGVPGGLAVNQFLCTNGDCRGYAQNMFYTRMAPDHPNIPDGFVYQGQPLTLLDCATPNTRPVWRAWPAGSPRFYRVGVGSVPAEWQAPNGGHEILGCVW